MHVVARALIPIAHLLVGCANTTAPAPATASDVVVAPVAAVERQCPAGSRRDNGACVATEVSCPPDSKRVDDRCVSEVHCELGTSWDGTGCRPAEPEPTAGMRTCTLLGMSTPSAEVFVDGKLVGVTPVRVKLASTLPASSMGLLDGTSPWNAGQTRCSRWWCSSLPDES